MKMANNIKIKNYVFEDNTEGISSGKYHIEIEYDQNENKYITISVKNENSIDSYFYRELDKVDFESMQLFGSNDELKDIFERISNIIDSKDSVSINKVQNEEHIIFSLKVFTPAIEKVLTADIELFKKIYNRTKKINILNERINELKYKYQDKDDTINELNDKLNALENKNNDLEGKLDITKEMSELNVKFNNLERNLETIKKENSDLENKLQASENKINNLEGELEAIKKENSELKNKLKTSEKYVENLNLKNENLEEQYRTITVQNLNDKDYCIYENKKDHDVTIILRNFLSIADKIFKTDLWKSNSNNKRTDLYHFANNEFVDLKDRRLILKPNEKVGIIAWGGGNTFTEINLIFSVIN